MTFKKNYLENRELILVERDDNGKIIDVINLELEKNATTIFHEYDNFKIAKKNVREHFKGKELELFKEMYSNSVWGNCYISDDVIESAEKIFEICTFEEIKFALAFKYYDCYSTEYSCCNYYLSMEDWARFKSMNFFNVLEWVKNNDGIYYAVDNEGNKGYTYLENKPTLKQAKYQRQKNGKRIAFLSFKDFKEYAVSEDELS